MYKFKNIIITSLILIILTILYILSTINFSSKTEEKQYYTRDSYTILGPNGGYPVSSDVIKIDNNDRSKIVNNNLTLAIALHDSTSDFSKALLRGIKNTCLILKIDIIAITDCNYDPDQQVIDYENILKQNPDIIITLAVDREKSAKPLRRAVDKGIKLVFLSNIPEDFEHTIDYSAVVTDDLFLMGQFIAEMIIEDLHGNGTVGLFFHDADYFVTNKRDQSVKTVLSISMTNVEIVEEVGIKSPGEAESKVYDFVSRHPEIDAIYIPWDILAEGAVLALKRLGNKDVKVYTIDLGMNNALDMLRNGNIKGIIADYPFVLGETLVKAGALSAIGEYTPPFITVPATKIRRYNVKNKWEEVFKVRAPDQIYYFDDY